MKKIDNIIRRLTKGFAWINVITLLGIVFVIVLDVFLRFLSGQTLRGAYEMVQYLLMIAVFSSFAFCQTERGHVHVTMLVSKFPRKLRFIIYALTEIVSAAAAFLVAYAAIKQGNVYLASNMTSGVLLLPLAPFYWLEGLCMAVFGLSLLWEGIKGFAATANDYYAQEFESL